MKTIVFDFGNVIGFFSHRLVTNRLVPHAGVSAEVIHSLLWDGPLEDDYEAGRITTSEFLRRVREAGRLRCSEEVLIAAYEDIFWPNPEVIVLLPRFKPRDRLLLASNTNELHARKFLAQFAEPLRPFDHLVLSHQAGARKPKAAFFEYCQRLTNCAPEECVFIDDLPANVAGARACGWQGIHYRPCAEVHQQLMDLAR